VTANARSATVEAGAAPAAIAPAAAPRRDGDARPSRLADALRAARWTLRRWSLKHIWYRARLPIRRRRWAAANLERTQAFAKDPAARPTAGPAIAFGEFSGRHGLGRAAAYDLPALRARHAAVTAIDIGPYLEGAPRRRLDLAGPFDNVYFLCQPDTYGMICELLRPSDVAAAYRVGDWVWRRRVSPRPGASPRGWSTKSGRRRNIAPRPFAPRSTCRFASSPTPSPRRPIPASTCAPVSACRARRSWAWP